MHALILCLVSVLLFKNSQRIGESKFEISHLKRRIAFRLAIRSMLGYTEITGIVHMFIVGSQRVGNQHKLHVITMNLKRLLYECAVIIYYIISNILYHCLHSVFLLKITSKTNQPNCPFGYCLVGYALLRFLWHELVTRKPKTNSYWHWAHMECFGERCQSPSHNNSDPYWIMVTMAEFGKPCLWNTSANLLNLCLVMWQLLSRPNEDQSITNLLSLIQWYFSAYSRISWSENQREIKWDFYINFSE